MASGPRGLWWRAVAHGSGVAALLATQACSDAEPKSGFSTKTRSSGGSGGGAATSGTGGASTGGTAAGGSNGTTGGNVGTGGASGTTGGNSGSGGLGGAIVCKGIEPADSGELHHALALGTGRVVYLDASCDGSFVASGYFTNRLSLPKADGSLVELTGVSGVTWLAAFDPEGTARWAEDLLIGPTEGARAGPFVQRFDDGSVVSGGTFGNLATFASGEPNEVTLRTPSDQAQGYVVKYGADGRLLWVKHVEGIDMLVTDLSPGPDGSTYAEITTTYAPGHVIGPGEIDFSIASTEVAIAVLDAGGRFVRAGTLSQLRSIEMVTLSTGALAITGHFTDGAVIGGGTPSPRTLTSTDGSGQGSVLAVLTPELEVSRVQIFSELGHATPLPDGSLLASDVFQTASVSVGGPMGMTLMRRGGEDGDGYVARFDSDGALSWVAQLSSTEGISSLTLPSGLSDGTVFIGGRASGEAGQDIVIQVTSGAGASRVLPLTGSASFFVRFSPAGDPSWIVPLQSDDIEYASAISASPISLVAMGTFSGTLHSGSNPITAAFAPTELDGDTGYLTVFGP